VRRILDQPRSPDLPRLRSIIFLFFALSTAFITLSRPASPTVLPTDSQMLNVRLSSAGPTAPVSTVEGARMQFVSVIAASDIATALSGTKHPSAGITAPHPAAHASAGHPKGRQRGVVEPAKEGSQPDDASSMTDDDNPDEAAPVIGEFTADARIDSRAFSMGPNLADAPLHPVAELESNQPFVPNSSFIIRLRKDTIRPEMKLSYTQEAATRDVEIAIKKMQQELQRQLRSFQATASGTMLSKSQLEAQRIQRQILVEQLMLQQEYLQKQLELEKRLEKARRKITIVYI
jgi:hypothetical protein